MKSRQVSQTSKWAFDYRKLRYKAEAELERVLEEDFSLAQYYDIFDNQDELNAITNDMLSNTVLLSPAIAPRIYDLCSEIKQKLGFSEQIDFYLLSNAEVNAFSINGFGFVPHIICFTSALIQLMTDDELRFVIGHEIGHLIYQHNKLNIVQRFLYKKEEDRPPAMLTIHYLRFIKYAELSADRIGFIAMPDINVVTHAFFKLTCGLTEKQLNFVVAEYLKQLERIREIGVGDLFSSHPNSMIRIQALMDFCASELSPFCKDQKLSETELNANINELMQLLETKPKNDKDLKKVEFLATLGMFMASYDQDSFQQKWDLLYDWISDYTSQPENYLQFDSAEQLSAKTEQICQYYAQQQDNDKFAMMEQIVFITLMDGRLESEEKKRLYELASKLNVSQDALHLIIRKCSENYLAPNKKVMVKGVF